MYRNPYSCRCGRQGFNHDQINFIVNDQSKTVMHFKSQRVDARVDHAIATIDITQVFLNELETPVEATYQIPID